MPIASSRDDIIMPCKEKVALIFLLLTCTVATELGSGACHAPGPVLYSSDVRARDYSRLRRQGRRVLRRLGGPPPWITHQLLALHTFYEFNISSPITQFFLKADGLFFHGNGGSAPASNNFESESSTHCFWNCDFVTTEVAPPFIESTVTSRNQFSASGRVPTVDRQFGSVGCYLAQPLSFSPASTGRAWCDVASFDELVGGNPNSCNSVEQYIGQCISVEHIDCCETVYGQLHCGTCIASCETDRGQVHCFSLELYEFVDEPDEPAWNDMMIEEYEAEYFPESLTDPFGSAASLASAVRMGAVPRATARGAGPQCLDMFDDELCWNEQKVNEYDEQFIPNGGVGAQAKGPESVNSGEHTPGTQTGEGLDLVPGSQSSLPRSSTYPKGRVEPSFGEPQVEPCHITPKVSGTRGTCEAHEHDQSQPIHMNTHVRTTDSFLTLSDRKAQIPVQAVLQTLTCLALGSVTLLGLVCMADVAFADSTKSIHDSLGNATHSAPGELQPKSVLSRLHSLASTHPMMQLCMFAFLVMTSVCFMYPGAGNALRTPPAWGPEMESTYSFRQWSRDILLWSIASDLEPARKAAAVMLTLRGAARELSRQIPPQAVVAGGLINGAQVDPLTYLMHALQERFGNLGEEVRVQAITELMSFNRKGNEPVDSLLVRFDSIRARAAEQGGAVVGVQGVAWILLRAIGISDQQLIQLLAPLNGLLPANEAELTQLKTSLRRMGHILERTPGNLREGLRISGPNPSHAFMTQEESWREHPSNDQWNQYEHSTSHEWSGQAAFNASSSSYPSNVDTYATFEDDDIDTDSNTSSGECSSVDAEGQDPNRVAQSLFWAYKQAKHKSRKFMGKSTRAVRRYAKRFHKFRGKGKGKKGHSTFTVGKGKGKKGKHPVTAMLAEMDDAEVQMALPAFRGQRTPGKGKGRRSNPKGPDGQLMRCFECGSTEHLAGSCPRRAHSGSNPATTFFARPSHTDMTFAGPLAGLIDDSDLQPIYHVSTASQVTFATHAEDTESGSQTYHAYMFSSDETDPLQQHDPWGSQTSQSWSVPTSAPQSYGPAGRAPPQSSWFPFGMFGRQQPSNPASRSWEPEHVPPENRPSPSHNASEHEPIAPGSPAVPSHEPVGHSMNWASIAQMPSELRNLLPFPVLAPPTVPAFAERPEFGFLEYRAQPQMPSPPTFREPQLSQLEGPAQMQIEDFHFVQQHVAYQRQHYRDMPGNRPALQVRSQLDHQRRPQMAEFHQTQRDIDRLRRHRKDRIRNVNTAEAEYDGAADTCPLCCEKMEANESVLRLVCKHLYHVECWTSYLCHGEQLTCPVCRGSCHVIARFRVPADTDGPQRPQEASRPVTPDQTGRRDRELPDTFNIFTPPGRAPRINSESPEVGTPFLQQEQASNAYPWWPTESAALTTAYHSISIPDRAGVIIDPGAYTNLIGENTARMFAQKAIENGFKPRQWKMKPMYVQGVGEGQQKCEWTVSIPIACNLSVGGTKVCLNYFEASVVGGSGARLPALLGLKSLTSLSATLCMHANQEALYVPLPGGSIEDLQQCRKCPLSKAPSGHLIMTIDHWKELQEGTKAGVQPKPMVLHVDPYQPSQPSAPSSSM